MLTIRAARVDDAEPIWRAEVEWTKTPGHLVARPHEPRLQNFRDEIARLAAAGRYVVAEEGGEMAGHAFLSPMPLEAIAHVFRLAIVVHPGRTGQGIGKALMTDLMVWARAHARVGKIELNVRATNAAAIALYRKLGFVEEGRFVRRVRLADGTFIDDLAMAWFPRQHARSERPHR